MAQGEQLCREASRDSGKPMVDAAFGEVMVTCEKISWLLREGERYLKPEKRSPGVMVIFLLQM
jgi:acyl-CoA reductase-like NAD-dependent aldehyde dehydrogenase